MVTGLGVIASDTKIAAPTLTVVVPVMLVDGSCAVIVAVPTFTPVTRPAATVAIVVSDELHVEVAVTSCVVLSVHVPSASSWTVRPAATLGAAGDSPIDASTAGVTFK